MRQEKYGIGLDDFRPVIVVADNDKGLDPINGALEKQNFGCSIHEASTEHFFTVYGKMRLVLLPLPLAGSSIEIEDLYPKEILTKSVRGKKYDKRKKHEDHSGLGKQRFLEQIILPMRHEDIFSGFIPLLDRIVCASE
jgi:hypothetical protein